MPHTIFLLAARPVEVDVEVEEVLRCGDAVDKGCEEAVVDELGRYWELANW